MRLRKSGLLGLSIALLTTAFVRTAARADAPSDDVVARVGEQRVTAIALERMIANVPAFQLRTLGKTPAEIRRAFLDRVVVRDLLLAEGAVDEHLADRPDVRERLRGLMRASLVAKLRAEALDEKPITDADVKSFYDENIAHYSAPARVAVWRILVATRQEAEDVLDKMKSDPRGGRWNELAREKSLDKATSMRGGELGFLGPDGTSSEPGVKVDPAIATAAAGVKDGEFVPTPVAEGTRWAVVWRKQSMKPTLRTLEQEAPAIRQTLGHNRAVVRIDELLARLRKEHLSAVSEELIDQVDLSSRGEVLASTRPGVLPTSRHPSASPPAPANLR